MGLSEVDLPFDFNSVVDIIVPVYTTIACVVIIMYMTTRSRDKKEERYALKKKAATVSKDWKEQMNGKFHQYEVDGLDEWLIFCGKPYPIRLIAPKIFLKICHELTVRSGKFEYRKTFLEGKGKDQAEKLELGVSSEDAKKIDSTDDDGNPAKASAWVVEDDKQIWYEVILKDQKSSGISVRMSREMIDEDTIEVKWYGSQGSTGKKCEMTSYFRRVE